MHFPFNFSENLRFFEYLRRNSYLRRSSKIFQNSEESSSSSSVYFQDPKILRLRLRSIFNLRCNTVLNIFLFKLFYQMFISLLKIYWNFVLKVAYSLFLSKTFLQKIIYKIFRPKLNPRIPVFSLVVLLKAE